MSKVVSKLCPQLSGNILRWIDDDTFIASIVNRRDTRVEMLCHKDYWTISKGETK